MIPGRKLIEMGEESTLCGTIRIRIPIGEYWIHPDVLKHIRGLERIIDSLEEDRRMLIDEIRGI